MNDVTTIPRRILLLTQFADPAILPPLRTTCGRFGSRTRASRLGWRQQGSRVTNTPRVLVFDGLSETETVLRAVFEPQGASVERRRSSETSVRDCLPPQVVVVDLDDPACPASADAAWPDVPRVVLSSDPHQFDDAPAGFLEKPFDYPELVRLVQSLLDLPTELRRVG